MKSLNFLKSILPSIIILIASSFIGNTFTTNAQLQSEIQINVIHLENETSSLIANNTEILNQNKHYNVMLKTQLSANEVYTNDFQAWWLILGIIGLVLFTFILYIWLLRRQALYELAFTRIKNSRRLK